MRTSSRSGPDARTVIAARAGRPDALDSLVAESLPLVYNLVGRALDGHADVDDVVQEVMLRVVGHLRELRDPSAYRAWLAAIAIRQLRDREQHRARDAELDDVQDVPDPASDFTAVTILRLGLKDQRREVAEATRWLDRADRTLLALWWLEEAGHLDRAEVAGALGLSNQHAAVRVQRMKETLLASRSVVRALAAHPACRDLYHVTHGWDGAPNPLWRKRITRHIRECRRCARAATGHLPVERLLAGLPLLPIPVGLTVDLPAVAAHAATTGGTWLLTHLPWLRRLVTWSLHGSTGAGAAGPITAFAAVSAVVATGAVVAWPASGPPEPTAAAAPAPSASAFAAPSASASAAP